MSVSWWTFLFLHVYLDVFLLLNMCVFATWYMHVLLDEGAFVSCVSFSFLMGVFPF